MKRATSIIGVATYVPDMVVYERRASTGGDIVGEWDDALSWIAHPHEEGKRASHALKTNEGVWLIDPLDMPGLTDRIAELGSVAGVLVLSCWHTRDAGPLARQYDVSVHIPEWMGRVESQVAAPVERYTLTPGGNSDFRMLSCRPFPGWQEVFLSHQPSSTLVIPDSIGTTAYNRIADEKAGLELFRRLQPPRELRGLQPERLLVGHGPPIDDNAARTLRNALDNGRGSFPRAFRKHGVDSIRMFIDAVRE